MCSVLDGSFGLSVLKVLKCSLMIHPRFLADSPLAHQQTKVDADLVARTDLVVMTVGGQIRFYVAMGGNRGGCLILRRLRY